jgi:hypothetical protein
MVAPLEMHASRFLTAPNQAPKVFTVCGVPGGPGSHDLHRAMVPCGFLSLDPPH